MSHHDYVYPGHRDAVADALDGVDHVTPQQVTELRPFQRVTTALRSASGRRDLSAAEAHAIVDGAERAAAVLRVALDASERLIADVRAGLGDPAEPAPRNPDDADRPPTPNDMAPETFGTFQPSAPESFESGDKPPDEVPLEDKGTPRPSLYPNGPPTEEILNQPDPPTGEDIQHEAGNPITTDTTPGKDDGGDDQDEPKSRKKKGK